MSLVWPAPNTWRANRTESRTAEATGEHRAGRHDLMQRLAAIASDPSLPQDARVVVEEILDRADRRFVWPGTRRQDETHAMGLIAFTATARSTPAPERAPFHRSEWAAAFAAEEAAALRPMPYAPPQPGQVGDYPAPTDSLDERDMAELGVRRYNPYND